jgi:hypothetical protein
MLTIEQLYGLYLSAYQSQYLDHYEAEPFLSTDTLDQRLVVCLGFKDGGLGAEIITKSNLEIWLKQQLA